MSVEYLHAKDLRLADVVELYEGPHGTATVKQIKDGMVTMFRPYTQTSDFEYTGGVICYIGIETFTVLVTDSRATYKVWQRGKLK